MSQNQKYFEIKLNVLKQLPPPLITNEEDSPKIIDFKNLNAKVFPSREATKEYLSENVFFDSVKNTYMKFISRMKYDKRFVGETLFCFLMLENLSGKTLANLHTQLGFSRELALPDMHKENFSLNDRELQNFSPKQIVLLPFNFYLDDALHESTQ